MIPLFIFLILLCLEIITADPTVVQDDSNATFHHYSILQQMKGVSRLQCVHRCERDQECKHIAYQKDGQKCTLLKNKVLKNDEGVSAINENEAKEKINDQERGRYFLKDSTMTFTPHQVLKSKW